MWLSNSVLMAELISRDPNHQEINKQAKGEIKGR